VFFCKRWAPFFKVKQRWAPFLPGLSVIFIGFLEILPRFQQIKTFGVRFPLCTPTYYTTAPGKSTFGPCLEKILPGPCLGVNAHLPKW